VTTRVNPFEEAIRSRPERMLRFIDMIEASGFEEKMRGFLET
jgi:hypothetical protein